MCLSFVKIIQEVLGSPPDLDLLKLVYNFLLAVHPATNTYVCHTPTSFFFSLHIGEALKLFIGVVLKLFIGVVMKLFIGVVMKLFIGVVMKLFIGVVLKLFIDVVLKMFIDEALTDVVLKGFS